MQDGPQIACLRFYPMLHAGMQDGPKERMRPILACGHAKRTRTVCGISDTAHPLSDMWACNGRKDGVRYLGYSTPPFRHVGMQRAERRCAVPRIPQTFFPACEHATDGKTVCGISKTAYRPHGRHAPYTYARGNGLADDIGKKTPTLTEKIF
jgi:hypothetical protein